ncbi:MAG: RICIN domain-containing protein [Kibdelosporangium sp.]
MSSRRSALSVVLTCALVAALGGPAGAEPVPPDDPGAPVELTELRTETTRIFANPSGTRTMEQYLRPVRARKGADWVPIDTTLSRADDGSVGPGATVTGLRLSGGGTGPLVTLERDGKRMSLAWPGALPVPTLERDTATYPEVLPGVDLRVRADADGFSQLLVVKNAAAAANPALSSIKYGTSTDGVTVVAGPDGSSTAVDDAGRVVFASGAPSMWESERKDVPPGVRITPKQSPMGLVVGKGELEIVPDRQLLSAPDTTYPVYIDPSYSALQNAWTYVNGESTGTSYWTSKDSQRAKVGEVYGSTSGRYRTFFQMAAGQIGGSQITRTWFSITLDHSANCAATSVELWHTRAINPANALTWANSSGHWLTNLATASGKANEASCPQPDMPMEFASAALTTAVQSVANSRGDTITFGLRIPLSHETDEFYWKYFYPSTARINVEYNNKPRPPAKVTTVPASPCGTAAAPTPLTTNIPGFSAVISDPDGDNVSGTLEILNGETVIRTLTTPAIGSGAAFAWPQLPAGVLPTDQPTTVFSYRARTKDAALTGDDSTRCYFTVDQSRPGTPTITSTDFPESTAVRSVGETGTVTFDRVATDTDVTGYQYGFQQDRLSSWVGAEADGHATVPVTLWPESPGGTLGISRTLYVRAVDRAGNSSLGTASRGITAIPRAVTTAPVHDDTNGDRRPDITVMLDQGDGRTAAWNFLATGAGFTGGYIGWDSGPNGGFPAYRTTSVRGDFDNDGRSDLAVFREDPDRKVRLYFLQSDGNRFIALGDPVWTTTAYHLSYMRVVAGDFDADGDDDIAVFQGYPGNQTKLWVHTAANGRFGEPVLQWDSGAAGLNVTTASYVAGDFDGDGRADIGQLRGTAAQTKLWVHTATATGFAAPVQQWDSGAGNLDRGKATFLAADVNGDAQRRAEIVVMTDRGSANAQLSVLTAGTGSWTNSVWWTGSSFDATQAIVAAGDFSGDGKADVAALYATGGGKRQIYTFVSTGTAFTDKRADWQGQISDTRTPFVIEPGRAYRLQPKHSEKCAELANNTTNGSPLHQADCVAGAKYQQFSIVRIGASDYYTIQVQSSSKCLDVQSSKQTDNAVIHQWTCGPPGTPQPNQQFRLDYVEGGGVDVVVQPRIVHSEKCLDVASASTTAGAAINQFTCAAGKANQQFYLRPEA